MVGRRFAALAAILLGGCSLSTMIDSRAVEYNQVEEDVNNQILVTNVLRARDGAPLYLAEFQNIHVSLTSSVATGNIFTPFGRGKPIGKYYSASPNGTLTSQPTFDATQLDTQQFTLGMLKPIDPVTWEYYWRRSYSPELLLHLFLASVNEGTLSYNNDPCTPSSSKAQCDAYSAFTARVDKAAGDGVYLNIFTTLTPADPQTKSSELKTLVVGGKTYSFEQSSPQVAICTQPKRDPREMAELWTRLTRYQVDPCPAEHVERTGAEAKSAASTSESLLSSGSGAQGPVAAGSALNPDEMALFACTHRQVVQCRRTWAELQQSSVEGGGYVLRSVDGIIRYLGRVQQAVDADPADDGARKGVTWTENGMRQTLFQLHAQPGEDRIAVTYRGKRYYVRQGDPGDHTLEVLALLNQLINANKNANEIPSTKAVQIVP
jgi:hypothetical protein